MRPSLMPVFFASITLAASVAQAASPTTLPAVPPAEQNLVLDAPINKWDEAIPLGNGLMGGLLWGEGNTVRLSLDRGDLWDERPFDAPDWWKTRPWTQGGDWDKPYSGATPTKLPAGRLELTLAPSQTLSSFTLNLATAQGHARFADGGGLSAFFSAVAPVAMLRIDGPEPEAITLLPTGTKANSKKPAPGKDGVLAKLGYAPAVFGQDGQCRWYVQDGVDGYQYCVCIQTRRDGNQTVAAVAVTSTQDGKDVLGIARRRCAEALADGYDARLAPHAKWWQAFWEKSTVSVPEPAIQRYYAFSQYLYGAGSRRGAPPMPLQGVWTADNGTLPPWKGDYHNDLNTQMTYMAYQEAGRFDEGASYLDFLWNLMPRFQAFAHDFYGTDGLAAPGVMSLAGQPLGGWGQYSLSPTMTAWSAHLFYLHWRYTADDTFLKDRAYPWCAAAGTCMRQLLHPGPDGKTLVLTKSSSPEIFNNSAKAWLVPNSNYDLSCLKMLFLSLQEMADALGKSDEAKQWADAAAGLGDFHVNDDGVMLLDAKTPLPGSHRHLSNIIGMYPFNLITRDGGAEDSRRIDASLAQWDKFGTRAWCGYSFAWMGCLRARVGDAEAAMRNLDIFVHAFCLRNGFHANGDQTKSGLSGFTYRPFTLEGNFLASQLVQEMLLQSWSPTPGRRDTGVIRIFPATPWRWHDAAFNDLRAEGGYTVSARREKNATTWFRIVASRDGVVRIRDNFGSRPITWEGPAVRKVGDNFEVSLQPGQAIEAVLATPTEIPEPPSNLAEPFTIRRPATTQAAK